MNVVNEEGIRNGRKIAHEREYTLSGKWKGYNLTPRRHFAVEVCLPQDGRETVLERGHFYPHFLTLTSLFSPGMELQTTETTL